MPEGEQVTDQDYSNAMTELAAKEQVEQFGTLDSDVKQSEDVVTEELAKAGVPTPETIVEEEAAAAEAEPVQPKYLTDADLNTRLASFSEALQRGQQSANDQLAARIAKMLPRDDESDPWVDMVNKYCAAEGVDPADPRIDKGEGAKSFEEAHKRMRASVGRIQREGAAAPVKAEEPVKNTVEAAPVKAEAAPTQANTVVVPPVQKGGGKMTAKDLDEQMAKGEISWQDYNKKCAELGRKL